MKAYILSIISLIPLFVSAGPIDQSKLAKRAWDDCPNNDMIFNYGSGKCYSPARHPDPYNCQYIGKCYDSNKQQCYSCRNPGHVPTCPDGQYWRKDWNRCDWKPRACHDDERYDPHSRSCVSRCDHDWTWNGHQCVENHQCRWDQEWDSSSHRCVCKHHDWIDQNGVCVEPHHECRWDQEWDWSSKACVCKHHDWIDHNGVCVEPHHECRWDQEWDWSSNTCVCKHHGWTDNNGQCSDPNQHHEGSDSSPLLP